MEAGKKPRHRHRGSSEAVINTARTSPGARTEPNRRRDEARGDAVTHLSVARFLSSRANLRAKHAPP